VETVGLGFRWERCSASGYSLKTDAVFFSMMAAAIPKSPGQAWGKNGFFLSPTSARCPVSAVQPSVQSPQAFDPAETGQNRREYPRQFAPKPQPDRRIGVLFLCPHSFVMPRAPPIHHETILREYRDALHTWSWPGFGAFSRRVPTWSRPVCASENQAEHPAQPALKRLNFFGKDLKLTPSARDCRELVCFQLRGRPQMRSSNSSFGGPPAPAAASTGQRGGG